MTSTANCRTPAPGWRTRRASGGASPTEPGTEWPLSTISIGSAERPLAIADAGWISRAFETQANAQGGAPPCVRVLIRTTAVDLTLRTPNCAAAEAGGGRPPSREESEIARLWHLEGLSSTRYTAAQVVGFVERVRQLLR